MGFADVRIVFRVMKSYRIRVWIIIVLQISIPSVMLAVRWHDPSGNQMPFGWQMHTSCWGADQCP